jgi:hypothetical protein
MIAAGWTLIRVSETDFRLASPLEAVLVVGLLYAVVWWAKGHRCGHRQTDSRG